MQNVLAGFSDSEKGRLVKVGCALGFLAQKQSSQCGLERFCDRSAMPAPWLGFPPAKYASASSAP